MTSSPHSLFKLNLAVTGGAVLCGSLIGWNSTALIPIQDPEWRGLHAAFSDLVFILGNNFLIIALLILGALSFGILSLGLVLWNGFFIGFNLPFLLTYSPWAAIYLALYAPFEFLAIALAATIGESAGVWFLEILIFNHSDPFLHSRKLFRLGVLSVMFISVAGVLETVVKVMRNYAL